jgi:hypothetical protein
MINRHEVQHEVKQLTSGKTGVSLWMWVILAATSMLACPDLSHAANSVGKFTIVAGSVDALREQMDAPIAAEIGMDTYMSDVVRTKHRSRTQLKFIDNSVLNMGPDYLVKIKEYVYDEENGIRKAILSSLRGTVRATVSKLGGDAESVFEIETPTAVASVRGTDFIVKVNSSLETEVIVLEGAVRVRNIDPDVKGFVVVRGGEKTTVTKNAAPTTPSFVPVKLRQALIAETTPTPLPPGGSQRVAGRQGGNIGWQAAAFAPVDIAPVAPPPPTLTSLPVPRVQPVMVANQPTTVLPPTSAQPPITQTTPAIVTAPVTINLIF